MNPAPAIILVEPQLGENIGTAARAMANFGLTDLRVVAPRDGWPNERAIAAASGAYVIDAVRVYSTVAEAVADLSLLFATTAREREVAKPVLGPVAAAAAMRARISSGAGAGILFGRERTGLQNADIALADAIVTLPVDPRFASLNIAQAVLILGYEWRKGLLATAGEASTPPDAPVELSKRTEPTSETGVVPAVDPAAETAALPFATPARLPADKADILRMMEHLERALDAVHFFHPPEKRAHMVQNLRAIFARTGLTDQEVRTLRGVITSLERKPRP